MKQSLQLRISQQLTMTPQLQQAIRMLQLSTLELQTEVQQALESNIMLEDVAEAELDERLGDQTPDAEEQASSGDGADQRDSAESMQGEIPDELAVDTNWDDIYQSSAPGPLTHASPDQDREFDHGDTSGDSLREHLLWQLQMTSLSERDRNIADALIDAINDDGFLSTPLDELFQNILADDPELEEDEVQAVLHCIQNFDPPGVAAQDLRESLLLQLRALPGDTPHIERARQLLEEYFELLAARDYAQIKRRMKTEDDELADIIRLIQSLNPRPGGHISNSRPEYIIPDVIVHKVKGHWQVELNQEAIPRLRVNNHYANLINQVKNSSETVTLKNQLQEARWFIKSLVSRNETLLKVAGSIVQHQYEFLEQGDVAMKPLVLHDIADELEMHESTISRTTTRKYMHTPRGIFELKYFFSSHVGTSDGGECSSTAIRALIKQLIGEENTAKPLSDNKIAALLGQQGINVARRTVAKYREAMAIPPSNERKRLA